MSIIRVGLAETKNFAQGYEDIFGKAKKPAPAKKPVKTPRAGKKKAAKRKTKKK